MELFLFGVVVGATGGWSFKKYGLPYVRKLLNIDKSS